MLKPLVAALPSLTILWPQEAVLRHCARRQILSRSPPARRLRHGAGARSGGNRGEPEAHRHPRRHPRRRRRCHSVDRHQRPLLRGAYSRREPDGFSGTRRSLRLPRSLHGGGAAMRHRSASTLRGSIARTSIAGPPRWRSRSSRRICAERVADDGRVTGMREHVGGCIGRGPGRCRAIDLAANALAYSRMKERRSALTWSLRVVHIPCGAPG